MADENKKYLLQLVVLAHVNVDSEDAARVLGGNLARQIEANMPNQFEPVGVELQAVDNKATTKQSLTDKLKKDEAATLKT